MGKFNEPQVGRFNRMAQKLLSMKGPATIDQVANDLRFVIPLFYSTENRYLEGWDLFGADVFPALPGAGNSQGIMLRNPPGSNVVAVVTRYVYSEAASTIASFTVGAVLSINRGPITTDLNTPVASKAWDSRGRPQSTCIVSTNVAAPLVIPANGQGVASYAQQAFVIADFTRPGDEIPLLPGEMLLTISGNQNTQIFGLPWWRERFLEDSERA